MGLGIPGMQSFAQQYSADLTYPTPWTEGVESDIGIHSLDDGDVLVMGDFAYANGITVNDLVRLDQNGEIVTGWGLNADFPVLLTDVDAWGTLPDGKTTMLLKGNQAWNEGKRGAIIVEEDGEQWAFVEIDGLPEAWEASFVGNDYIAVASRPNNAAWEIKQWAYDSGSATFISTDFQPQKGWNGNIERLHVLSNGNILILGENIYPGDGWVDIAVLFHQDGSGNGLWKGKGIYFASQESTAFLELSSGAFLLSINWDVNEEAPNDIYKFSPDGEFQSFLYNDAIRGNLEITQLSELSNGRILASTNDSNIAALVLNNLGQIEQQLYYPTDINEEALQNVCVFSDDLVLFHTQLFDYSGNLTENAFYSTTLEDGTLEQGWPVKFGRGAFINKIITSQQGIVGILSEAGSRMLDRSNNLSLFNADGSIIESFIPNDEIAYFEDAWIGADGYVYGDVYYWTDSSHTDTRQQYVKLDQNGQTAKAWTSPSQSSQPIGQCDDGFWFYTRNYFNEGSKDVVASYDPNGVLAIQRPELEISSNPTQMLSLSDGSWLFFGTKNTSDFTISGTIHHVNSDYSLDTDFAPPIEAYSINAIKEIDGKLLVSGDLGEIDGESANLGAWLSMDGEVLSVINDPNRPHTTPSINDMMPSLNADGDFMRAYSYDDNGKSRLGIFEISPDGSSINLRNMTGAIRWATASVEGGEDNHFYIKGSIITDVGYQRAILRYSKTPVSLSVPFAGKAASLVNSIPVTLDDPQGLAPSLVWYFNDQEITTNTPEELTLSTFAPGTYRVDALIEREVVASKTVELSPSSPAKALGHMDSQIVLSGRSITLGALCEGNPFPSQITWYRDGIEIGSGPALSLSSVNKSHAGNYYYTVENATGNDKSNTFALSTIDFISLGEPHHSLDLQTAMGDAEYWALEGNRWLQKYHSGQKIYLIDDASTQGVSDIANIQDEIIFDEDFYAPASTSVVNTQHGILCTGDFMGNRGTGVKRYHLDGSQDMEFGEFRLPKPGRPIKAILNNGDAFFQYIQSYVEYAVCLYSSSGELKNDFNYAGPTSDFIENETVISSDSGYFATQSPDEDYLYVYTNDGSRTEAAFDHTTGYPFHMSDRYGIVAAKSTGILFTDYDGKVYRSLPISHMDAWSFCQTDDPDSDFIAYINKQGPENTSDLLKYRYELYVLSASNNWTPEKTYEYYGTEKGLVTLSTDSDHVIRIVQNEPEGTITHRRFLSITAAGNVVHDRKYYKTVASYAENQIEDEVGGIIMMGNFNVVDGIKVGPVTRINAQDEIDPNYTPAIHIADFNYQNVIFASTRGIVYKTRNGPYFDYQLLQADGNLIQMANSVPFDAGQAYIDETLALYLIEDTDNTFTVHRYYNGSIDQSFNEISVSYTRVYTHQVYPDGRLLLSGRLTQVGNQGSCDIAVIQLPSATIKTRFRAPFNNYTKDAFLVRDDENIYTELGDSSFRKILPTGELSEGFSIYGQYLAAYEVTSLGHGYILVVYNSSGILHNSIYGPDGRVVRTFNDPLFNFSQDVSTLANGMIISRGNTSDYSDQRPFSYHFAVNPVVMVDLTATNTMIPQGGWIDIHTQLFGSSIENPVWTFNGQTIQSPTEGILRVTGESLYRDQQLKISLSNPYGTYSTPLYTFRSFQPLSLFRDSGFSDQLNLRLDPQSEGTWEIQFSSDMINWQTSEGFPLSLPSGEEAELTTAFEKSIFFRAQRVE